MAVATNVHHGSYHLSCALATSLRIRKVSLFCFVTLLEGTGLSKPNGIRSISPPRLDLNSLHGAMAKPLSSRFRRRPRRDIRWAPSIGP